MIIIFTDNFEDFPDVFLKFLKNYICSIEVLKIICLFFLIFLKNYKFIIKALKIQFMLNVFKKFQFIP